MQSRGWEILLLVSGILALAIFAASAQIGDEDRCRAACREAKDRCVSGCGMHSNPIECESRCQEQRTQCDEGCR
jgi:hypothetical protein